MVSWQRIFIKKAESEKFNRPKETILINSPYKIQTAKELCRKKQKSDCNKNEIIEFDTQVKSLFVKKKFNILMVADQLKNDEYDRRFVDTCIILCEQGHNVTILATYILTTQCFELHHRCGRLLEVGGWIPRDICGAGRSFCYWLRSVYLALWAYACIRPPPDLVICNSVHLSAMRLFRWIKDCKLLTFFQVFNQHQVPIPASEYNIYPAKTHNYKLNHIHEVLCANKLASYVFNYSYKCNNTKINVLYPTVRKPLVISIDFSPKFLIPANAYTFLSHYSIVPASKFEIIIRAFGIMYISLERAIRKKCYLILMGIFKKNKPNRRYMQLLKNQIIGMNMQNRIFLLTNVQHMYLRNLLSVCYAYIHVPSCVVCEDIIIEAMAAGKPIIANNTGFPCEVIKHKETGYLLPLDAETFADAMTEIITNQELYKSMCTAVQFVYDENFSYPIFAKTINKIIQKYMEPNKKSSEISEDVTNLNYALEEMHKSLTSLPIINVLATHQELIMDKFYHDIKLYSDTGIIKED